jgi:hypothetical protein
MIVGFDVVLLLLLPLLLFSVFTFQAKGNAIIMGVFGSLAVARWGGGLLLLGGDSSLKEGWLNLWAATEQGRSPLCLQ